jgi:hypothetical protein
VARGVTETDLERQNAEFATPRTFAELTAAADKVVSF